MPNPLWTAVFLAWAITVVWLEFLLETSLPPFPARTLFGSGLASEKFWLLGVIAPPLGIGLIWLVSRWAILKMLQKE